jgi:autotransporter-associated beta strand protein
MQFSSAASDYTFTVFDAGGQTVTLNGLGIVSSSGSPVFNVGGGFNPVSLLFTNSSGAGNATLNNLTFIGGIQFSNFSSAQNAVITNNFANLAFRDSSTASSARIFNYNTGAGAGTTFFDTSTAANATILNSGGTAFTIFRNSSTAGNATISNENCGETEFFNSSSASRANINIGSCGGVTFGDSSTAGSATVMNNFTASFSNNATADNATIITANGGLTVFGNSSTAASATIVTLDVSRTVFLDRSNGGQARFITDGSGVVDFSATSGQNNDRKLTAGSIEGTGSYLLGGNQLSVGGNNMTATMSGIISDCGPTGHDCAGFITLPPATLGSLVKVGTGTLTLSGINTYTGPTTVDAGRLIVDGSIAASGGVTINATGTLGGNGIVGNTVINGGTLAPGNSIGTLTVQGSLAFTAAASYIIEVSSSNASRTDVTGTATLGGTVRVTSPTNSFRFNSPYTILTSAGLVGTQFDALATPTGVTGSLNYSGKNVQLNLMSALGQIAGLNANQHAVASALDAAFNAPGGQTGLLGGIFAGNIAQNLTQASGETATGSQQTTFNAMTQFLGLLLDPYIDGRGDNPVSPTGATPFGAEGEANAYANGKRTGAEREAYAAIYRKASIRDTYDPRWSFWAAGFGGSQTTDGNAALGSNNTTSRVFGMAAGADYIFSPRTIAGFALSGGGTSFSVANGGSGLSDLFQAGAFIRHTVGAAYLSGALAYGWQDVNTDRLVMADKLHAEFNANALSGRVEGGYRFATRWMGITPYAAGQFTSFWLPAYAESAVFGSNAFALAYSSQSVTDTRSELGVRTDRSFALATGLLTLRGRLAWAHDFNPDRALATTFQALPGASFVINGAAQASDSALTTASAEMKWRNGWSTVATFEGEFSHVTGSYAGKGVVRYVW